MNDWAPDVPSSLYLRLSLGSCMLPLLTVKVSIVSCNGRYGFFIHNLGVLRLGDMASPDRATHPFMIDLTLDNRKKTKYLSFPPDRPKDDDNHNSIKIVIHSPSPFITLVRSDTCRAEDQA